MKNTKFVYYYKKLFFEHNLLQFIQKLSILYVYMILYVLYVYMILYVLYEESEK